MTDLRSGLCHGPNCQAKITRGGGSEDFCGDDCQAAWHALHADPPMPSLSVHLPSPAMARWTPEGGAPITPETSTWQPTSVVNDIRRPFFTAAVDAETDRFMQSITEDLDGMASRGIVTTTPPSIYQGDALADLEAALRRFGYPLKVERPVEVGEAATQSPIQRPLSFMSRLWRWVWFRG